MIRSWASPLCLGDCNQIAWTESDLLAYRSYSRDPQLTEVLIHCLFMSLPMRIDTWSRSHDLTWCVRLEARIWRIPPPRCVWFGPLKMSQVCTLDPLFQVPSYWLYFHTHTQVMPQPLDNAWYGASQCGPLNNTRNPTLGLKTHSSHLFLGTYLCIPFAQTIFIKAGTKNECVFDFYESRNCLWPLHWIHNKSALTEQIDDGQNGQHDRCSLWVSVLLRYGNLPQPIR